MEEKKYAVLLLAYVTDEIKPQYSRQVYQGLVSSVTQAMFLGSFKDLIPKSNNSKHFYKTGVNQSSLVYLIKLHDKRYVSKKQL